MFNNLIESKAKKQRTPGGMALSVVIHAVLIGGAVYGTLQAGQQIEKVRAEKVEFMKVEKKEPPPPKKAPPPPDVVAAPPPPKGFQVLTAPIKIPDVLPKIDLSKSVTNAADFSGKGVAGGIAKGVVGGTAPVTNQTFYSYQVEKQVEMAPGNQPPHYPDVLRSANLEGEVLAQFVVDTNGRADMSTFKALKTTHDLFVQAVRNSLRDYRFYAAEIGGKKVKQLVQQSFQFTLNGR